MRKLVFQEFLSLDGYAADKNNSTSFFDGSEYADESDKDLLEEMQRFDLILLGANTYRMFAAFWPTATNDEQIVADQLNSIPRIVFSTTLTEAPWGKWEPAKIISTDAVDAIRALKATPGKDMVLWGSISLAQALINANLIDEYQLRIVPVLLGEGTLLFKESTPRKLSLTGSRQYTSGLMLVNYKATD